MDGSHRHNVECNYFHKVQKQVKLNYRTGRGVTGFKVLKQEQNTLGSSYWDESGSLEGERLEGREGTCGRPVMSYFFICVMVSWMFSL